MNEFDFIDFYFVIIFLKNTYILKHVKFLFHYFFIKI